MKLAEMTWQDVAALSRDVVVLIPTGSIEQHGPHLPLFTDSLLATSVTEAVESNCSVESLLLPTVWLGCSAHHLGFDGSLTNSFHGYDEVLTSIITNLIDHGFHKFYIINAHGGNTSSNDLVCRQVRTDHPGTTIGHVGYFQFIPPETYETIMEGRVKTIRHACEAEASLMLHLHPHLVRKDKLRDDGFHAESPVPGLTWMFDEVTEEGSLGQATLATPQKGKALFDAAITGLTQAVKDIYSGIVLVQDEG